VQVGATYRAGRSSTIFSAYIQQENLDLRIVTFATIFPFAVLLFAWCKADATHRGIEPPNGAALLVGLFALIGIPYYYFRILPPLRAAAHEPLVDTIRGGKRMIPLLVGIAKLVGRGGFVLSLLCRRG
jgi:hypothetical protein